LQATEEEHRKDIQAAYHKLHTLTQHNQAKQKLLKDNVDELEYDKERLHQIHANLVEQVRMAKKNYEEMKIEYENVMSERTIVLKENEELSTAKERMQDRLLKLQCDHETMEQHMIAMRKQVANMHQRYVRFARCYACTHVHCRQTRRQRHRYRTVRVNWQPSTSSRMHICVPSALKCAYRPRRRVAA
jgi:predicted nuclease with TOPRIM domain